MQPGNSGGPLLDSQANVIGIVVSKLNAARIAEMTGGDIPQNVNFAVKGTEGLAFLARQRGAAEGHGQHRPGQAQHGDRGDRQRFHRARAVLPVKWGGRASLGLGPGL